MKSNEIGQVITFPRYEGISFNKLKKPLDTKINVNRGYILSIYNLTMTPYNNKKYQIPMEKSNKRSLSLLHRKQKNTIEKN